MNSFDQRMASPEDKHISKHFAGVAQVWGRWRRFRHTSGKNSRGKINYLHSRDTESKTALSWSSPDGARMLAVRRSVKRTARMMALTQFEEVTRAST